MIKEFLQGRFMRHPLHPLFVHFPVALWILSLFSDLAYLSNGNIFFAQSSYYLIGIGICVALLAAITGMADLIDIPRGTLALRIGLTHAALNVMIVALYTLSFFGRGQLGLGSNGLVSSTQLILNVISVGLLLVSGYLGGTMVYSHGVGLRTDASRGELGGKLKRVA